jgi:predicted transcriptional regulator
MSLWNPATRSFEGPMLHRALIARGYTMEAFAVESGVQRWSIYNALRGRRVRDQTAIRIFRALEKRNPMTVVYESLEVA